jgi:hypothetical protein
MLETRKLTNHKSAQCHVSIEDNGTINFISYTTLVKPFHTLVANMYYFAQGHTAKPQESR